MSEFINITNENLSTEHLCCAIGDKKHQAGVDVNERVALRAGPAADALAGVLPVFSDGVVVNGVEEMFVGHDTLFGLGRGDAPEFGVFPFAGGKSDGGRRGGAKG